MTDREMLELAAKAVNQDRSIAGDLWSSARGRLWDPLNDDGDALRLAASSGMILGFHADQSWAQKYMGPGVIDWITIKIACDKDRMASVRMAIVRCAATIGAAQKDSD